jgi:uncharacterized circularly permuted ATP-grasp superfamily protein
MEAKTENFSEVFGPAGESREYYRPLFGAFERLETEALAERLARADEELRELGATFPLPDDPEGKDRVLPAHWMPRIIPRDHWERLSAGLLQRGRAINAWLGDLYNGDQDVVPEEIVESSALYRPHPLPERIAPVYGPDVVHLGPGEYAVLEDNVRVPSGVAYSEAIRRAGFEAMGDLFGQHRVNGIHAYYAMLRATLEAAAPPGVEEPYVALVTGGPDDSAFFEHRRIAEACGIRLLMLGGCQVRNGEVLDRFNGRRIDVVYRRFEEDRLETDLPEIKDAYLEGNVSVLNAFGVGVADDKAVFPYVPAMIERYLGEESILAGVPTFSLSEPEQREEVLERLDELVLKPREGYGGSGILIGPEASREDVEDARRRITENPPSFVAQETLDFSTHVVSDPSDRLEEAFVDLRAFVLPTVGYVMPGGLTRVSRPGTRVVNSSAGGSFKDTWVL